MIIKTTYRDQVRKLLLNKMKTGQLSAGDSLSLAAIARDLKVSVTPIREALTQLEYSGIIKSIPNRGFVIPEISNSNAISLYQLLANIEALAIENSIYSKSVITKLKKQQEKIEIANNSLDRMNADIKFHDILTSQYKSETAQQILIDLKVRIFFYEMDFMNDKKFHNNSKHHHHNIISYIENGKIKEAAEVVKKNWLQIIDFIKT